LLYFARALIVADESESTKRAETNWWGRFNNKLILDRSTDPATHERKTVFDSFFKKPSLKQQRAAKQRMKLHAQSDSKGKVSDADYVDDGNTL
jgi:hypothetical protein